MLDITIKIDPALLRQDGREWEASECRTPKDGEWILTAEGSVGRSAYPWTSGPRLILREKRWEPRKGEKVLILNQDKSGWLWEGMWAGCSWQSSALANHACWPLSRRAEAEATVAELKAVLERRAGK